MWTIWQMIGMEISMINCIGIDCNAHTGSLLLRKTLLDFSESRNFSWLCIKKVQKAWIRIQDKPQLFLSTKLLCIDRSRFQWRSIVMSMMTIVNTPHECEYFGCFGNALISKYKNLVLNSNWRRKLVSSSTPI